MTDYSSTQCAYAMAQLLRRLIDEGYIVEERTSELRERARNLQHDRGFITDAERQTTTEVEDLLS